MLTYLPGGEIKRDPEIGKTAIQPEPAQTANLSISGSRFISPLCRGKVLIAGLILNLPVAAIGADRNCRVSIGIHRCYE